MLVERPVYRRLDFGHVAVEDTGAVGHGTLEPEHVLGGRHRRAGHDEQDGREERGGAASGDGDASRDPS